VLARELPHGWKSQRQAVPVSHLSFICSLAADVVTLRSTQCQQCCQNLLHGQTATVAASSSDCFAASAAGGAAVRCVILVARPFAVWIVAPDAIPTASGPSTKLKLKRLHQRSQSGVRMIPVADHRCAQDRAPCTVTQTLTRGYITLMVEDALDEHGQHDGCLHQRKLVANTLPHAAAEGNEREIGRHLVRVQRAALRLWPVPHSEHDERL
jgi:hypothetical protein